MSGATKVTIVRERETKNTVVYVQVADPDNVQVRTTEKGPRLTPAPDAIIPSLYVPKSVAGSSNKIEVTLTPLD